MKYTTYQQITNEYDEWVNGEPSQEGQKYRKVIDFGEDKRSYVELFHSLPTSEGLIFSTKSEAITANGQALGGMGNTFYAPVNAEIQLQADIVDALGNLQTQIDQVEFGYPPVLKMPVVKMAGGINGSVVDEVYFTVTLNKGVLTATGSLPASGDWKLLTSRINNSLSSIGADWQVERENTTFLA